MRRFSCSLPSAFCLLLAVSFLLPSPGPAQVITTVAGSTWVFRGDGGTVAMADLGGRFSGLAMDAAGNVYAADADHCLVLEITRSGILKVVAGNGICVYSGDGGLATSASLNSPGGIAVDSARNVYIAESPANRIRRVSPNGIINTLAGNGLAGYSGDGGPATRASLDYPTLLTLDSSGNLYVADSANNRIRKVTPEGIISTLAGNGTQGYSGDGGPAPSASLNWPVGVTVDVAGNLYIADSGNNRIRRVTPSGIISTVAGNGTGAYSGDGGPATRASVNSPFGLAVDPAGNLYLVDEGNNCIRKVTPGGTIATVAGSGLPGYSGDGGPATSASLSFPGDVAVDSAGNLYVTDTMNWRVRKVTPDGIIATMLGGTYKLSGDGGPATAGFLAQPFDVAVDFAGNLHIVDWRNSRVRKVSAGGIITTEAGNGFFVYSGDGGPATAATLTHPNGAAVDFAGNLYISDSNRVRKVTPGGVISTVAGNGQTGYSGDGGPATSAALRGACGVATDSAGNLYIADSNRIRKVTPSGTIGTVAGNGQAGFAGDGGPATNAALNGACDLALDSAGNLYISDWFNNRVRKVTPGGAISTVAGNGRQGFSGDGGPATVATLNLPNGVAVDSAGNVYIADTFNHCVRTVSPGGIISTVAGNGRAGFSGDGGPATVAALNFPNGVAVDSFGNVYIADSSNDRIRKVLAAPPAFTVAPLTLRFSASSGAGAVAPQMLAVTSPVAGLVWSASISAPWLTVAPLSGVAPALISVGVDIRSLAPGSYQGTVAVQAPLSASPAQTVSIELTVLPASDAKAEVDATSITFEMSAAGNPPEKTFRVSNRSGSSLVWLARLQTLSGGNWLSVFPPSGTASAASPATVRLVVNGVGLPPGVYSALITIESSGAGEPRTVPVDLLVSQASQTISLSQTTLQFTAVEGEATAARKLGIVNTGQGTMNWTARAETVNGGSWLTVSSTSAQSEAGSVIVSQVEVAVNTKGLKAGSYAGFIRLDAPGANNSPRLVTVTLSVLPAGSKTGTRLSPSGLIFAARAGGGSPSSQLVNLTTSNPGQVAAVGQPFTINGGDWLKVLPTNLVISASDPRIIVVQPDAGKLSPGEYRGSLTYQFSDGSPPQAVDIYFLVVGSSVAAASFGEHRAAGCTPTKLIAVDRSLGPNFTAQVGAASGLEVQAADDCGNAVWDATVVANFSNGDAPLSLSYLRDGIYTGTWRPGKAGAAVTVTLRASLGSLPSVEILQQGKVDEGEKTAAVFPGGVVHAASFTPNGALAPGSIISVFGANLASTVAGASSLPLPRTLAGASLQVGGFEVPLFYSSGGQINAQLPFELPPNSRPQLIVKGADFVTVPETITVARARPGIFTTSQDGKGQGVIMDAANRLVDDSNPAKAGDVVVVYCTGLGATQPAIASGQAAPSAEPLARVALPVTATVGGKSAVVHFAGLAPGFVGLYQVNVQIPDGITPGSSVPLVITDDGVPSNTVTLAIK